MKLYILAHSILQCMYFYEDISKHTPIKKIETATII